MTFGQNTKLKGINTSRLLFLACWGAYASAYVGRLNYSTALASIIDEGIFTKAQAGLIGTVFFFCYGGGQLINGFLADKLSPFRMIFCGLTLSAAANLSMFFSRNFIIMAVIWGLNGIAQSMLWTPIMYIISNILHDDVRYKACLYIASTFPCGTLTAYAIAAVCSNFSWRLIFAVPSLVLITMAVIWTIITLNIKSDLVPVEITAPLNAEGKKTYSANFGNILITSGLLVVLCPIMFHGMLKEGIGTWVPTMITEAYGVTPSFSIFVSMVLPIINLGGAFFSQFIFEKLTKRNEVKSGAVIMAICIIPLAALLFIGKIPLIFSVIMLSMTTMMMHAFNHLYLTLAPLRFGRFGRTATVTGLINAITYLGCAISTYGFGWLSELYGWSNTVFAWIGIAAAAIIVSILMSKKWGAFTKEDDKAHK